MIKTVLAFSAAIMATTAVAQELPRNPNDDSQIGTRFKRKQEFPDVGKQRAMQKDVAKCVVYGNKDLSRKLLANSDSANIDFDKIGVSDEDLFEELDVDECLGRAARFGTLSIYMTIPFRTLRNLMAEEVYLMDQKEPPVVPPDAPVSLENRYFASGNSLGAKIAADLSDCIAKYGTVPSHELLRSRPGSKSEGQALEALFPALLKCAGEGVADADIDVSTVRTVVADGMWARIYYGPTAPVADTQAVAESKEDDA